MNQSFGSAIVLPQPIYNFFGAARSDFGTSKHRHVSGLRACPARSGSGREHGRSEINYTEMKTQEPHQPLTDEDDEVTLVAPRFDDEETIVARRVVPLEEVERDAPAATAARARPHSRTPYAQRRPWLLAFVFASSLVGGGVIGGAGLHFYQRR